MIETAIRTRDPPQRRTKQTAFHSPRTEHITNSERRRLIWKNNERGMIEACHRRIIRDREEAERSDERLLELADRFAALLSDEYRCDLELEGHATRNGNDDKWKDDLNVTNKYSR